MKLQKYALIGFICMATVSLISCKKENGESNNQSQADIGGIWTGTYGFGNDTAAYYFSLRIKQGGVIEELNESGEPVGSGTWKLNGKNFTATYQMNPPYYTIYSFAGNYQDAAHKLTGTWGYENNASDGGWWILVKE